MSDPLFRPWVDKEEAAEPPLVERHVTEQQQKDENELKIEPSGSQQRAPTEQATEENGNRENKFPSKEHNENTIYTPQPTPAHTSQASSNSSKILHETILSSFPLSLGTETQHLTSPLPCHSGYNNSFPGPYTPKRHIVPTMSSPLEAASAPVQTSETTKSSYTPAALVQTRAEDKLDTNSLPQFESKFIKKRLKRRLKNQNIMNRNTFNFQQQQYMQPPPQYMQPPPQYKQSPPQYMQPPPQYMQPPPQYMQPPAQYMPPRPEYKQPPPQYMQPYAPVGMSPYAMPSYPLSTAGQYCPTSTSSQGYTTVGGYPNYSFPQPRTDKTMEERNWLNINQSAQSAATSPLDGFMKIDLSR